ncbi:SDR family oxidoreductase [Azoarcus sp. KH32C]|uniref:SDR family NAD(P)-dependent oxidoreductase n=1 Tax=Azoarcus sp. KH32C TaxID=748247 RepID=UPI0002386FB5|nr:SDR family oxidoreductase [Azoarcus sp. KH32C]BAL23418.1 putative short-chain dehydrogenase/reductase SDR [Azoarcus sp. KH32C]
MKLDEMRGAWALVTGASSGIGKEFCTQLAGKGLNLVLVARREDRLQTLAARLEQDFGIRTLVIVQDLGAADAATLVAGRVASAGIRVRLLVNNAAFGRWGRFEDTPQAIYRDMLAANTTALVELTHALLPDLAAGAPSAIINVASAAAYQPVPYMAVYAATKAFVLSFSQALYGEWCERGVLVQTLIPGATDTEFDEVAGAYASAIAARGSAADVVRDSIRGLERGSPVAVNAPGTFKQRMFAGLFPAKFVISQVAKMFRPPNERL